MGRCSALLGGVVSLVLFQTQTAHAQTKVAPGVYQQFGAKDAATFWVFFGQKADMAGAASIESKAAKGGHVIQRLKQTADASQSGARDYLTRRGVPFQSYWITNAIKVTANRATLEALAARAEVSRIVADGQFSIPTPRPSSGFNIQAVDWNLIQMRAPEVWAGFGDTGQGIVVASIDTGVDFTHEALVNQYRGNAGGSFDHAYNFFDPNGGCGPVGSPPCDTGSHGTHTMGTMVGGDGPGPFVDDVGVAPGARWIAAVGCIVNGCPFDALMASGQWMLAPTDASGNNPDPSRAPHVINNSWGGGPGDPFYQDIVSAWAAAGIFPAFSNGNSGPGCGSAGSPGDYPEAFAAGAVDINGTIAFFSSRGPSFFGPVKPDISAPGVDVRSSVPGGYALFSGTSMASPHVAGTVALLWAAAPALIGDVAGTAAILRGTAVDSIANECGGDSDGDPNNTYGEGRLDAFEAVSNAPRTAGTLQGVASDATTGAPIGGARIQATRLDDGLTRSVFSAPDGSYALFLPVDPAPGPESFEITATAFGYFAATASVSIVQDAVTVQDLALSAAPQFTVSGLVTGSAGTPLAGVSATLLGTPIPPAFTDASGAFSIAGVPAGDYQLAVSGGRCTSEQIIPITVSADLSLSVSLNEREDAFGYRCTIDPSFDWVSATTPTGLAGDDASIDVPLPFPFTLYGETFTTAHLTSNGFLNFLGPQTTYFNFTIPSPELPNAAIYLMWDDLVVDFNTPVMTETLGSAPDRIFVIEYRDVFLYASSAPPMTFEMKLHEGDGTIEFLYLTTNASGSGGGATVGLEDSAGTTAFQYSSDEPVLTDGLSIRFTAPPIGRVQGTITDAIDASPIAGASITVLETGATQASGIDGAYQFSLRPGIYTLVVQREGYADETAVVEVIEGETLEQSFALRSARAVVMPAAFDLIVSVGETRNRTLTISNAGLIDLTFDATERSVASSGLRVAAGPTALIAPVGYAPRASVPVLAGGPVLVLMDAYPWGRDSLFQLLNTNNIPFDIAGSSQLSALDLSVYEAVFVSSDQPQFFYSAFSAASAQIESYVENGGLLWVGAANGFNGGSIAGATLPGGTTIQLAFESENMVIEPTHPLVQGVPSTFFGSGASHATFGNLPAEARSIALGGQSGLPTMIEYDHGAGHVVALAQPLEYYFGAGDIGRILENGVPYAYDFEPNLDVSWLSLTPTSGVVAPGASASVQVTIATAGLAPGLYRARIALHTNDPRNATLLVPVTVIVSGFRKAANSGGGAFTDHNGDVWSADQLATTTVWGYTNNRSSTDTTNHDIEFTVDDPLYRKIRVDAGGYRFPQITNGKYQVELLFAELDNIRPNRRLTDIYVENQLLLPAHDVFNDVGRFAADRHEFMVDLVDGTLNIQLVPRAGSRKPIISAIRVTHRPDRE